MNLNKELIAAILDNSVKIQGPVVELPKSVVTAMCCELLRFIDSEGADMSKRVEFVQKHTAEFMALRIADLVVTVRNDAGPGANIDAVLKFIIDEIEHIANCVSLPSTKA